jgi:hypothetical protein
MNNKILTGLIVFLLLIISVWAFHMYNSDRYMEWNPMHNIIMWGKINMWDDDWMKEYCKIIPEMEWCEDYQWENTMEIWNTNKLMNTIVPTMPWQEAFGTIQEIINILVSDPKTNWKSVNIDALREHLIDMDQLTMYSKVERENIDNWLKMIVTWTGRTLDAINRMVTTHKSMTLDNVKNWNVDLKKLNNWVILTVISDNTNEVDKIRGLWFIWIMAIWSQHPVHHLMMAKWQIHIVK